MCRLPIGSGAHRSLWWVPDSAGNYRGKEYFEQLKPNERAKFQALFNRMATVGIRDTTRFRKEAHDLYCFKVGQHRLACFCANDDVMALSGFRKKANWDKRAKRELERAARLRDEYLKRTTRK